ncbi:MAG: hypothetical protein BAJALOKI1v1_10002 [Promethearchaeota archaeon]|nr:MAG: hypothetical protein BAJALOKI1v1_10002 [Candidatus Lokiarchaeota archaeon]
MSLGKTDAEKNLYELTKTMLLKKQLKLIEKPDELILRGKSGKKWKFDLIVQNDNSEKFGIFVKDWKREISVTQLRQLNKACRDIDEIAGGILVCNQITSFAEDFSEHFGVQILSRGRLVSKLRNYNYNY